MAGVVTEAFPVARPRLAVRRGAAAPRASVPLAAFLLACAATWVFVRQLGSSVHIGLTVVLGTLFLVLCLNVALFVVTGLLGFFAYRRGRAPRALAPPRATTFSRTAVLFPVCDEDTALVFGNLQAVAEDAGEAFDFFVISNSRGLDQLADEHEAWQRTRARLPGTRVEYLVRRGPGRKAANIHEFCQVWGEEYDYLVILDADSVMTGDTLRTLVGLLDGNPRAGLIEVPAALVGGRTAFARLQQFASAVYGPIAAWGNRVWQRGNANYHGHNAILRLAPFREHCRLPYLSGGPPFGGEILSHDFVEAALLRRAGWEVWSAPELGGSYEACPPTIVEYLRRDRRWCQGNLQHLRVLFTPGLTFTSRLHFCRGVLQYVSAPLWLLFVGLHLLAAPPRTGPLLLGFALVWLVFRLLGVLLTPGPRWRTLCGAGAELVLSTLTWPVLVLHHTRFVLALLAGRDTGWQRQDRHGARTPFRTMLWCHRYELLAGLTVLTACLLHPPLYTPWLLPVLAAWLLAAPLSTVLSRPVGEGLLDVPRRPVPVLARAAGLRTARCARSAS